MVSHNCPCVFLKSEDSKFEESIPLEQTASKFFFSLITNLCKLYTFVTQDVGLLNVAMHLLKLRVFFFGLFSPRLEKKIAAHSSILAWRIHMDRRAWWATVHRVSRSWTQLSDFTFFLSSWHLEQTHGQYCLS